MKGGDGLTKARLFYLLLMASLFAYILGYICVGMSDGGGF
jgi:hypothetical protein